MIKPANVPARMRRFREQCRVVKRKRQVPKYSTEALESRMLLSTTSLWVAPNASGNYSFSSPGDLTALVNGTTLETDLQSSDVTVYLQGSVNDATLPAGVGNTNYVDDVYALSSTLNLTAAHIGNSGHTLTLRAAPGAQPIISGGIAITGGTTGWQLVQNVSPSQYPGLIQGVPAPANTYVAKIASNGSVPYFRDLYVNGQQAIRARTPNVNSGAVYSSMLAIPGTPGDQFASFGNAVIPQSAAPGLIQASGARGTLYPNLFTTLNDVETVITDSYTEFHLRIGSVRPVSVNGVAGWQITQGDPEYNISTVSALNTTIVPITFYLENALAFLDSPGEWFEDQANNLLYYYPRSADQLPNMTMAQSLDTIGVVMAPNALADSTAFAPTTPAGDVVSGFTPQSPPLLEIGSPGGGAVSNIQVDGIHFEYGSWLDPSYEGYRGWQAGLILEGNYLDHSAPANAVPGNVSGQAQQVSGATATKNLQGVAEAAVNVYGAYEVTFQGDTFEHLSGAGLTLYGGLSGTQPSNDLIQGNTFNDIASNAIIVNGDPRDQQTEQFVSYNDHIQDNLIENVGKDYHDVAAILAVYAYELYINNNTVVDVPWSGIAITDAHTNSSPSVVNITENDISAFNQVYQDGAGVYMDGMNYNPSVGVGSVVENNYIHDAWWPRQGGVPAAALSGNSGGQAFINAHDGIRLDGNGSKSADTAGITVENNVLGNGGAGTGSVNVKETDFTPPGQSGNGVAVSNESHLGTGSASTRSDLISGNNPASVSTYDSVIEQAGLFMPYHAIQAEDFSSASGVPSGETSQPYRPDASPSPTINSYTSGPYNGSSFVAGITAGEKLTYWVEAPVSGHYDFAVGASTDDTNDTVSVYLDGSTSATLSNLPILISGGKPGSPSVLYTYLQSLLLTAGYHKFTLQFAGRLTDLEFDAFYVMPDPNIPAVSYSASTGGVTNVVDLNTNWKWDADFTSKNQSITVPTLVAEEGIYAAELRTETQSNQAFIQVQLEDASGNAIGQSFKYPARPSGSLSSPTNWIIPISIGTLGSAVGHLMPGQYNLKITFLGTGSRLYLETVYLLPESLYPTSGG